MRPERFEFERYASLGAALASLRDAPPDSRVLAGGQSLLKQIRERSVHVVRLFDISGLEELNFLNYEGTALTVGALVSLTRLAVEPRVATHSMALAEAARRVGDVQVRSRATLGGNLLSGWSGDLAVALMASGASVDLCHHAGARSITVDELVCDGCNRDELIRGVSIPAVRASAFVKLSRRAADPAIVSAAAAVFAVRPLRIGLAAGGVHGHPIRLAAVENLISSSGLSKQGIAAACDAAAVEHSPPSTPHGSADYRRRVLPILVQRALQTALTRAGLGVLT
ncbi:MAG: FAD binding domain-containing protein [Gammaproteobacteria bacterium]|nr:FAD binding domain-containing protein [Gammaproteobacteria bacterium]